MALPGTSYSGLDTAAWIAFGATVLLYGTFFFVGFRFTRQLQISRMLAANGYWVSKMVLQKVRPLLRLNLPSRQHSSDFRRLCSRHGDSPIQRLIRVGSAHVDHAMCCLSAE